MRHKKMVLCGIALALFIMGCKKAPEIEVRSLSPEKDAALIEDLESLHVGVPFPEGSNAIRNGDGAYTLKLPAGYYYIISDKDGQGWREAPVIGIECKCTSGKGCDAVEFHGKFACVMEESCSCCESRLITENERGEVVEVRLLGMVNKNVEFTLISESPVPSETDIFPAWIVGAEKIHGNAFDELFEMEEVKSYFQMLSNLNSEYNLKPNKLAYFNIWGNVALVPCALPIDEPIYGTMVNGVFQEFYPMTEDLNSAPNNIRCNCNSDFEGCEDASVITPVGTVYFCRAKDCSSCSLINIK